MNKKIILISKFAKPHLFKFALLLFCIITTSFLGSLYPYIFGRLVDEVFYNKDMKQFLNIVIAYGLLFGISQVLHFILNMSWANLMTRFLFDIRKSVFNKVLSFSGKNLSNLHTGDIINRINNDSKQFMNFIHWNVFYTFGIIIDSILSIGFIIFLNWKIGIISIILVPIVVFVSKYFSKKSKLLYAKMSNEDGILYSWVYEMLKGLCDVKLLRASGRVISHFTSQFVKIYRIKIDLIKMSVLSERISSGLTLFATLCVYSISAYFVSKNQLTVGGFIACAGYFTKLSSTINALSNKILGIAENMAGIERVQNILESESENYNENAPNINILYGKIEFKNVKFSYDIDFPVLEDINFVINSGERIALVGRSGAGKTTMINLIYKLYNLNKGEIIIDNVNIENCNLHSLRSQIGIVHQETILFDETLRYNLIFSDNKINDEKIINALESAHLKSLIFELPEGLDTIIGANGQGLSGGQKQRISIARIFLKDPKILIFDEATSSLDSEAEQAIKSSWDNLCKGRTIIIIAHRLSTILNADKICVIENGTLVGFEKHNILLQSCDIYNQLFSQQYSNEEAFTND